MQESPVIERFIQRGIAQGIEQGIEQGIKQGMEKGIEQGARQMSIESTVTILEARFPGADVNALKPRLEAIADINRLRQVSLNALLAPSFHDFQEGLGA